MTSISYKLRLLSISLLLLLNDVAFPKPSDEPVDNRLKEAIAEETVFSEARIQRGETSLKPEVNRILDEAMVQAMERYSARVCMALLVEIDSGALIGLSWVDDTTASKTGALTRVGQLEKMANYEVEFGSLNKIVSAAFGVDHGVKLSDNFDVRGPLKIGTYTVKDHSHSKRVVSLEEGFLASSNILSVRVVERGGPNRYRRFLSRLGLTEPLNLGIFQTEKNGDLLENANNETVLTSFGYGLTMTPFHVAKALSTLVNGGYVKNLSLSLKSEPVQGPIIRAATSATIRRLLKEYTAKHLDALDQAFLGDVSGVTLTKEENDGEFINSFFGVFPADSPRYVLVTVLHDPQVANGSIYNSATHNALPLSIDIIREFTKISGDNQK